MARDERFSNRLPGDSLNPKLKSSLPGAEMAPEYGMVAHEFEEGYHDCGKDERVMSEGVKQLDRRGWE